MIGRDAIMVSAVNLMLNKENIWNWHFFGDFFKENDRNIYEDLMQTGKKNRGSRTTQLISLLQDPTGLLEG